MSKIEKTQIIDFLSELINIESSRIKATIDNGNQFATNVKCNVKIGIYQGILSFLNKNKSYIGKEVFHITSMNSKLSFRVSTIEDYREKSREDSSFAIFNKLSDESFILTEEKFFQIQNDYLEFRVNRLLNDLCYQMPMNSTNPMTNLINDSFAREAKSECLSNIANVLGKNISFD